MENKNMTISEYIQDMSCLYDKLAKIYGKEILEKLKNGKRLSKFEIYFVALQFNLFDFNEN